MKILFAFILCIFLFASCTEDSPVLVTPINRAVDATLLAMNGNNSITLCWGIPPTAAMTIERVNGAETFHENDIAPTTRASIRIYRSTNAHSVVTPATMIASVLPTVTTYTDTDVENGETYYYAIVYVERGLYNSEFLSEPSNTATGTPFDFDSVTEIVYSQHIQPIFTSSCAYSGCHAGGSSGEHDHATALKNKQRIFKTTHTTSNLALTSWDNIMKGSDHGNVIVPYKSTKSHLFFHINYDTTLGAISSPHMPLYGVNLPLNQIQLIKRWIDEGAKNDNGDVTLSNYPEGKILVTNQAEDLVAVFDKKTLMVSRYVQAGVANVFTQPPRAPHNLTVDAVNNCYYVNLITGGNVIKYRLSDNVKLGELSGIASPTQLAISADGNTGFSAQFAQTRNAIRMFDTRSMTLLPDSIQSPYLNKPHGMQFTPDYSELWVTGNLSDNIMVVSMSDYSVSIIPLMPNDTLAPGQGGRYLPYQTVMTSNGKYVYVTCQKSNEVRVIDRDSMKVVKVISVGLWPLIPAISPDDRYVYTADRNSNTVTVIRTSDNTVERTIYNVGPQPHGIALSSDGKFAYVSCENVSDPVPPHHPLSGSKIPGFLSVIDLTTNTVIKKIETGAFAAGVAVVE